MAERKTKQGAAPDAEAQETPTPEVEEKPTPEVEEKPTPEEEKPTPEPDDRGRLPSTTVLATEAGPLVPSDVKNVHQPPDGHPDSSTNSVSANAAQRSVPGSNHVEILDEDGGAVAIDDLFDAKDPTDPSVFVTVKQRVYQVFTYPGARTPTTQLLYPAGARVTVAEAERVKATLRAMQA